MHKKATNSNRHKYILAVDASSGVSSICLAVLSQNCVVESFELRVLAKEMKNSIYLVPIIKELLDKAKITVKNLSAVVVNRGPGSFTGCRLSICACLGLTQVLNIPLISVDGFEILQFLSEKEDAPFCQDDDSLFCIVNKAGYAFISGMMNNELKPQIILQKVDAQQEKILQNIKKLITADYQFLKIEQMNKIFLKNNIEIEDFAINAKTLVMWYMAMNKNKLKNFHNHTPFYIYNPYDKKN